MIRCADRPGVAITVPAAASATRARVRV